MVGPSCFLFIQRGIDKFVALKAVAKPKDNRKQGKRDVLLLSTGGKAAGCRGERSPADRLHQQPMDESRSQPHEEDQGILLVPRALHQVMVGEN